MSFLIILGTAAIAYLAICIVGYVKRHTVRPLYYEPRDLERGEVVKVNAVIL